MAALADFSTLNLSLEKLARDYECPVCFQFYDASIRLQCSHQYCKPCGENFSECPTCREKIIQKTEEKRSLIDEIKKVVLSLLDQSIKEITQNNSKLQELLDRKNLLLGKIKQVWMSCLHIRDAELSKCFEDKEEINAFINHTDDPLELFQGIDLANRLFSLKFPRMNLAPNFRNSIRLIYKNDLLSNVNEKLNLIRNVEATALDDVYDVALTNIEKILIKFAVHWKDKNDLENRIEKMDCAIKTIDKAVDVLGLRVIVPSK